MAESRPQEENEHDSDKPKYTTNDSDPKVSMERSVYLPHKQPNGSCTSSSEVSFSSQISSQTAFVAPRPPLLTNSDKIVSGLSTTPPSTIREEESLQLEEICDRIEKLELAIKAHPPIQEDEQAELSEVIRVHMTELKEGIKLKLVHFADEFFSKRLIPRDVQEKVLSSVNYRTDGPSVLVNGLYDIIRSSKSHFLTQNKLIQEAILTLQMVEETKTVASSMKHWLHSHGVSMILSTPMQGSELTELLPAPSTTAPNEYEAGSSVEEEQFDSSRSKLPTSSPSKISADTVTNSAQLLLQKRRKTEPAVHVRWSDQDDSNDFKKTYQRQMKTQSGEQQQQQQTSQFENIFSVLKDIQQQLKDKNDRLKEKDTLLKEKEKETGMQLKDKDLLLREKNLELKEKDAQIREKDTQLKEKDTQLKEKDTQLKEKDTQLKEKDTQLKEKDAQLKEKDTQLREKDNLLNSQLSTLAEHLTREN